MSGASHRIIFADVLDGLRSLESESINCVATSPPYWGLRDYGAEGQIGLEATPEAYVARLVEVFAEVRRVLREDGTLWLNLGDSYAGGANNKPHTGNAGVQGSNGQCLTHNTSIPAGLKPKDLCGIPWRVAFALQADGWWLRNDIIWCLSGGTRVYARTQKGEMPTMIKDLVRLDPATVQLWNGERWTQVLGWSEHETRTDAVQLTLRSGERIGTTLDHVWPTERGNVRTRDLRIGDVIRETRLPEPPAPSRPTLLPDTDVGWFVGMYIAEGSMSGDCIQIAGHIAEEERLARLERIAEAFDGTCAKHEVGGKSAPIHLYGPVLRGILEAYVSGEGAKKKHLSPRCWQRSNEFLRGIMEGYLDGDGHADPHNDRWRLGLTRNYNLEADLRTIAARLGMRIRLKPTFSTCNGERFPSFRGELRTESSAHHNTKPNTEVVAIDGSRARKFWHIGVADEPHLYALASGVLTHNSKPNPMPESVTDRFSSTYEHVFLLTKAARYWFDLDAVREAHGKTDDIRDNGAFDRTSRNEGKGGAGFAQHTLNPNAANPLGKNPGDVWRIATKPTPYAHFATWPPDLVERMILAGCPPKVCKGCGEPWEHRVETVRPAKDAPSYRDPATQSWTQGSAVSRGHSPQGHSGNLPSAQKEDLGYHPTCKCQQWSCKSQPGVVLDPFGGSGTTTQVARKLHRRSVLIELNPDYEAVMRQRLGLPTEGTLFGDEDLGVEFVALEEAQVLS